LLIVSAERGASPSRHEGGQQSAVGALMEACSELPLEPLDAEQVEQLVVSVFGDVPSTQLLAARLSAATSGQPRGCTDLIDHLLERGQISYERGAWKLPAELNAAELPRSGEEVFRQRLIALTPLARMLVEAQALASHAAFSLEDYAALLEQPDPAGLGAAISELIAAQVLQSDGRVYTLTRPASLQASVAGLSTQDREQRERALCHLYECDPQRNLVTAKHLFLAALPERALDMIAPILREAGNVDALLATEQLPPILALSGLAALAAASLMASLSSVAAITASAAIM
jgi:hypothetical protein